MRLYRNTGRLWLTAMFLATRDGISLFKTFYKALGFLLRAFVYIVLYKKFRNNKND